MKLFLLKARKDLLLSDDENINPWGYAYDKMHSVVVRAENETKARVVAMNNCLCEGEQAWMDSSFSTCVEINGDGEEGVIIKDIISG